MASKLFSPTTKKTVLIDSIVHQTTSAIVLFITPLLISQRQSDKRTKLNLFWRYLTSKKKYAVELLKCKVILRRDDQNSRNIAHGRSRSLNVGLPGFTVLRAILLANSSLTDMHYCVHMKYKYRMREYQMW